MIFKSLFFFTHKYKFNTHMFNGFLLFTPSHFNFSRLPCQTIISWTQQLPPTVCCLSISIWLDPSLDININHRVHRKFWTCEVEPAWDRELELLTFYNGSKLLESMFNWCICIPEGENKLHLPNTRSVYFLTDKGINTYCKSYHTGKVKVIITL